MHEGRELTMVVASTLPGRPRPGRDRARRRLARPTIAAPALVAWLGLTVTLLWPGPWLSPLQIVLLLGSLLPLGLNILTRLEAELEAPPLGAAGEQSSLPS